jgi:hypothetical protein
VAGWFIWWNSEAVGPIDSKRLARLVGNGDIGADDWLWHHEIGEWRQVRTLGLLPPAAAATPADSDVWPYGASETRRRSLPDDGGSPVKMPSLTSIYLKRIGRQPDRAKGAPGARPQPPPLPIN